MLHIHLIIVISARWSMKSFSFFTGHVSLPCNIQLCTQLLYIFPSHKRWNLWLFTNKVNTVLQTLMLHGLSLTSADGEQFLLLSTGTISINYITHESSSILTQQQQQQVTCWHVQQCTDRMLINVLITSVTFGRAYVSIPIYLFIRKITQKVLCGLL